MFAPNSNCPLKDNSAAETGPSWPGLRPAGRSKRSAIFRSGGGELLHPLTRRCVPRLPRGHTAQKSGEECAVTIGQLLLQRFDALTTSIRIEITASRVGLFRRRDGILEEVGVLERTERNTFLTSLRSAIGKEHHSSRGLVVVAEDKERAFQYISMSIPDKEVVVIKPVYERPLRPIERLGVSGEEAARVRHILTPPEGVALISSAWCGVLRHEAACLLQEGWPTPGQRPVHVFDYSFHRIHGLEEVQVDSTRPESVKETLNRLRYMELLPIVISLCDEELAVREAFRLAQLDCRVFVLTDSRPVVQAMRWIRRLVDPWVVSEYLSGIIGARSLCGVCEFCREQDPAPSADLLEKVGIAVTDAVRVMKGRGCSRCGHSGCASEFSLLALEILDVRANRDLARLLKDTADETAIGEAIEHARGSTMEEKVRQFVLGGHLDLAMAERAAFRRRVNT